MAADAIIRGHTPRELSRLLRVSPDKVLSWIRSGELGAINTASRRCGRPRYVVLPEQLAQFQQHRQANFPPKTLRRRKQKSFVDYYPN